ncbi:MAG: helix-turn-helix domain-containing protein [Pyrinomonadaceae bacterium]
MGRKPRPKPQRLAAKLLALRKGLNLSQPKCGQLLGIAYHRLSEFERGRREPNVMLLLQYARLAKVPVENLINDNLDLPNA